MIIDQTTDEIFKTAPYDINLLVTDEDLQLDFSQNNNDNKAEVVKPNLSKKIFCFKEQNILNCNDFCIQFYGTKMVVITFVENGTIISYKAKTLNSKTTSKVDIFDVSSNPHKKILSTSFTVDTNITSYKLSIHEDVISIAKTLKNNLLENQWKKVITVFTDFLLTLKEKDIELFSSNIGQSTTFHLSIFSTINRSLANNTECECLPVPYYFTGISPFVCQKDFIFNTEQVLKSLEDNKEKINSKYNEETILTVTNYFNKQTSSEITFGDIYFSLSTTPIEYQDSLVKCIGLSGTSPGCCGNYSGCCWYASVYCLLHDVACGLSGCEPSWACFYGCQ